MIFESEVVSFGKFNKLGLPPSFEVDRIVLHPIPDALQDEFVEGQVARGYFGRMHDSLRTDKNGLRIFVQYFIPENYTKEVYCD